MGDRPSRRLVEFVCDPWCTLPHCCPSDPSVGASEFEYVLERQSDARFLIYIPIDFGPSGRGGRLRAQTQGLVLDRTTTAPG
jgi:hypothetical protein